MKQTITELREKIEKQREEIERLQRANNIQAEIWDKQNAKMLELMERERTTLLNILAAQFPTPFKREGRDQDTVEGMTYPEFTTEINSSGYPTRRRMF